MQKGSLTRVSNHTRVSKSYNARYRYFGPFRQGRYRAKLVATPEYLHLLILSIHLNSVTAGVVEKPVEFGWSGDRELVRKISKPFVDPEHLLLAFDETRTSARKMYLAAIGADSDQSWLGRLPGELPW